MLAAPLVLLDTTVVARIRDELRTSAAELPSSSSVRGTKKGRQDGLHDEAGVLDEERWSRHDACE